METKFTKGPWSVDFEIGAICNDCCLYICDSPVNNKSDANLIAAAPEMYEMLASLQEALFKSDSSDSTWWEIERLLAKARGE